MEITDGQIRINHHWIAQQGDGFQVVYFDLKSKYPEIMCGRVDGVPELLLYANEHTLGVDRATDKPTSIIWPECANWDHICDGGRYTVRIALFLHEELLKAHT